MRAGVELQIRRRRARGACGAPRRRSSARSRASSSRECERLDEVVVGAGVEPRDPVATASRAVSIRIGASMPCGRSTRQTSTRRAPGIITSSTMASYGDVIARSIADSPVATASTAYASLAQAAPDEPRHVRVVFDDQNAHRCIVVCRSKGKRRLNAGAGSWDI